MMQHRRTSATGRLGQMIRLVIFASIFASFLAVGSGIAASLLPAYEPVENSMWKKRIRRLKLADPESTEEMLAHAGSAHSGLPLRT